MQQVGELYNGPSGLYLPEKISPEVLELSACIVCEHLHQAAPLDGYSPDNIGGNPILAVDESKYQQILEGIEQALSEVIPFDDYDHANPDNRLNPHYPRSQIVMRALMAGAIQDTFTEGNFVGRAAALIRHPEQIMERAKLQGETEPDAHAQLYIAYKYTYQDAQVAARKQIAVARQPEKMQWYAALDGLQPLISKQLENGRRTSFEKEHSGYVTELNHTTGHLLGRIYEDIDTIANGRPNRLPHAHSDGFDYEPEAVVFPEPLVRQVTERLAGLEGLALERAKLELAVGYLRGSITPNIHALMGAKIDQIFNPLGFFEAYAELTEPTQVGNSDQLIWSQPASEPLQPDAPLSLVRYGDLVQAKQVGSPNVNTRCPAKMHFTTAQGAEQFHAQFGAEVPRRFDRSPSDQAMHVSVEAYRAYIAHRLMTDNPLGTVAAYLKRYEYWEYATQREAEIAAQTIA